MTIRISISCEPDEVEAVRRLLLGFVVDDLKRSSQMYDEGGKLSDVAMEDILTRYDDGESIRDIAHDMGIDGRQVAGFVLGKRRSPNSPAPTLTRR